jgi:hypothetical protein
MRLSRILAASTIGLLMLSSGIVIHATASPNWQGWDDGEFDCSTTWGDCVGPSSAWFTATATLSSSISYLDQSSGNAISIQYNPDAYLSSYDQTEALGGGYHDWFQTGIILSNSCVQFTVEVYEMGGGTHTNWNPGCFTSVSAPFLANSNGDAQYYITEWTASSGYVNEVDFGVVGGGSSGGSAYDSSYPEGSGDWYWMRSNICLCGVTATGDLQNASFSTGAGSIHITSGSDVYGITPPYDESPTYIYTAEDSNMQYGCWQNSDSTNMHQSFGLGVEC